jgi:uncharacterized protein (DUF58 family)
VHWRSSARRNQLVVREFEQEVSTPVSIIVAGADSGEPPDSAYEAAISAAASVALYALATGHPVELFRSMDGAIDRLSYPSKGRLLRWFAESEAEDGSAVPLATSALRARRSRGTVVLCSTTTGHALGSLVDATAAIQAGGARAIVVAARSSTWSRTPDMAEEERTLDELQGGRARVAVVSKGEDLRRCLLL